MWRDVMSSPRTMQAYIYLRTRYGEELGCRPGDADTTGDMCNSGDIAVSVESELPAFAMVMLYRGGEIAVCGPGHGEDCLKEAERLAAGYLIEVVNAWVRDDNKRAKKLFKTHGYKVIGYSQRNNVPGVRYAKALR